MERFVLGDPAVHQHQCGSKKFFAGKPAPPAVLPNAGESPTVYPFQAVVQCPVDAGHEQPELFIVFPVPGQSAGPAASLSIAGVFRRP